MHSMVALADLRGLACPVGLPQVPSLSLESKVSPDTTTDTSTALPECWSLSALPGSPECALMVGKSLLPFYQINPWRVGRLSWDLVLLSPLVLASIHSTHTHVSTLTFLGCCLLFTILHLVLVLLPWLSCGYLVWPASHNSQDFCFQSSPWTAHRTFPHGSTDTDLAYLKHASVLTIGRSQSNSSGQVPGGTFCCLVHCKNTTYCTCYLSPAWQQDWFKNVCGKKIMFCFNYI